MKAGDLAEGFFDACKHMELTPEQYEILFGEPAPHVPDAEASGRSESLLAAPSTQSTPPTFTVRNPEFDPEPEVPSTEPPYRRIRAASRSTFHSYDPRPWPLRKRVIIPSLVFLTIALSPLIFGRTDAEPEVEVLAEASVIAVNPRTTEPSPTTTTQAATTTTVATTTAPGPPDLSVVLSSELDDAREALVRANIGAIETPTEAFDRDEYLPGEWPDSDGDCQSDFDELLILRSLAEVILSEDGCRVERGLWSDPYDGAQYGDPANVTVDITVPLAEAHRAGGWTWDEQTRRAYAIDLAFGAAHNIVGIDVDTSKGDRPPHEWRPPLESSWCRYAVNWTLVKERWVLKFDPDEVAALEEMLQSCDRS